MKDSSLEMTWDDFDNACQAIVNALGSMRFKSIYGIPRGGLVVAVRLSHLLSIPLTRRVGRRTLVVDDIADTGKTLQPYKDHYIATLYYKEGSVVVPEVWILEKKDKWIVFPWEVTRQTRDRKVNRP